MDMNVMTAISNTKIDAVKQQSSVSESKAEETKQTTNTTKTSENKKQEESGVIYEKTSSDGYYHLKNSALIEQLKNDNEAHISSLRDIVNKMITKQGNTLAKADDIWSFLASGNYTVDEAAKKKAQEEISEDGYWGVKQTSYRILDFAKALSGNDTSKADLLLDAFKKGFNEATKTWGKELPDISKKTYDAVLEKFDIWKKQGTEEKSETSTDTNIKNTNTNVSEVALAEKKASEDAQNQLK